MSLIEAGQSPSAAAVARRPAVRQLSHQFSDLAKSTIMSQAQSSPASPVRPVTVPPDYERVQGIQQTPSTADSNSEYHASLMPPPIAGTGRAVNGARTLPHPGRAMGAALTDTPMTSQPGSPQMSDDFPSVVNAGNLLLNSNPRSLSGSTTPKLRATTLDIPGLTRSRVSPDGRIAERDVGAKLIILMVGLPARGKSYLVKKITRYLNWLQHPTRIFNVGDRRRVAAGPALQQSDRTIDGALRDSVRSMSLTNGTNGVDVTENLLPPAMLVNGEPSVSAAPSAPISPLQMSGPATEFHSERPTTPPSPPERLDQTASFFDPDNKKAKELREKVAHETLDDLLKYVLEDGGSVGIFDATNHTQERRQSLIDHIRRRDSSINILFLESRCKDQALLEANMRLKLSGPDYKDKDPNKSLIDFQDRVAQYERSYQPLGDYEEDRNIPYCSLIDVGRKIVSFKVDGFLSVQAVSYFMNFNLAPRQIWLSRHGESMDNVNGRIGGDSHLSPQGKRYAEALTKFVGEQRALWEDHQREKQANTHFPPRPGDTTPPNPEVAAQMGEERNFCVWTSMLNRSIETAQYFNEDEYDVKQMRMLDELNAGSMNGLTYADIRNLFPEEYELRRHDKLQYRYPGPGGEGYLDIISRLRKVILEVERMTDHVMLIGHRSITRVLLAYFMGLKQEDISDLDVPLGVAYLLEPVSGTRYSLLNNILTANSDPTALTSRLTDGIL
jgi:6-phosphofructo-2-kinase